MKQLIFTVAVCIVAMTANAASAADGMMQMGGKQQGMHMMNMMDNRISLGLHGPMRQQQLANMREHLKAVDSIVGLIAEKKFAEASKIAHAKLGLTPEMQTMCNMFENEDFRNMGLAFHKSADDLGDVLLKKDTKAALRALDTTMQFCVACHATYRQ